MTKAERAPEGLLCGVDLSRGKLTDVGVTENESPAQFIFMPVHFTANDTEESLAVDQNFHTVLFNNFVEFPRLLHVLQVISETGAAAVLHTHSNELRFRLRHQLSQLLCSDGGQLHGCLAGSERSAGFRGSLRRSCGGRLGLRGLGLSQGWSRVF